MLIFVIVISEDIQSWEAADLYKDDLPTGTDFVLDETWKPVK